MGQLKFVVSLAEEPLQLRENLFQSVFFNIFSAERREKLPIEIRLFISYGSNTTSGDSKSQTCSKRHKIIRRNFA